MLIGKSRFNFKHVNFSSEDSDNFGRIAFKVDKDVIDELCESEYYLSEEEKNENVHFLKVMFDEDNPMFVMVSSEDISKYSVANSGDINFSKDTHLIDLYNIKNYNECIKIYRKAVKEFFPDKKGK